MKVLLLILCIFSLQIILKCDDIPNSKIIVNTRFNGKPLYKGIKIINDRKFGSIKKKNLKEKQIQYRKNAGSPGYTAFPTTHEEIAINGTHDRGPRVKKVLPNYHAVFRRKRSVNKTDQNLENSRRRHGKHKHKHHGHSKSKLSKKTRLRKRKMNPLVKRKSNRGKQSLRSGTNKGQVVSKRKARQVRRNVKGKKVTVPVKPGAILKSDGNRNIQKVPGNKKIGAKEKKALRTGEKKKIVKKKEESRRLIAARDARIEDYPYAVSIQKDGKHWCSGALLNQRLVITTANCVWKSNRISRMRVRAGSRHCDVGGQVAKIQEVAKHPRWSIRGLPDNDIALLLLDRYIKFSNKVHGVDLPNHAMMPVFEDAWVTSWGAERRDGVYETSSRPLQVYHTKLLDYKLCNNLTQRFGVSVSRNFICLAQTGRRAPCTRDTGAPAVSDGIVWGLASWGIRKLCGTERFPAMFSYTASTSNLAFITNATHYLMSDERFYPYADRFRVLQGETTTDVTRYED